MYLNWSSEAWAKFHKEHRGLILKVHQRVGFCNALDGSEDCKIEFKEGKGSFNMNLVISVQIFLFSNFSNMRSTRFPNTRNWSSPFGTSFQMTKAAVKRMASPLLTIRTFWIWSRSPNTMRRNIQSGRRSERSRKNESPSRFQRRQSHGRQNRNRNWSGWESQRNASPGKLLCGISHPLLHPSQRNLLLLFLHGGESAAQDLPIFNRSVRSPLTKTKSGSPPFISYIFIRTWVCPYKNCIHFGISPKFGIPPC